MSRDRWVRRVTFNATPSAVSALDGLPGRDMTDAINRAIRTAAIVGRYMSEDGRLTVVRADGQQVDVHIL